MQALDNVVRTRGSNPVEDWSACAWAFEVSDSGPSYGETAFACPSVRVRLGGCPDRCRESAFAPSIVEG
jgi:hypothetical protein